MLKEIQNCQLAKVERCHDLSDCLIFRYRQTVIRNIPQLQKLDNVAVTSEEMADAMRRGIDLDHPLDGGSDNQTARLQVQVQRQEQQEDTRRMSRNSNYEQQEYEQPQRKESIQVSSILSEIH